MPSASSWCGSRRGRPIALRRPGGDNSGGEMPVRERMTMTSDPEPILASWKISEVLERHPHLLDELVGLSPAFAKLRNPLLRRVQTRLVTVAQAAVIAKLEPAALVVRLNRAAGIAEP